MGGGSTPGSSPAGARPGRLPAVQKQALDGHQDAARELARLLWQLVKGSGLTLRELESSSTMPYSRDTISRRLSGNGCPEDAFLHALLRQCARGDHRRYQALLRRVDQLVRRARQQERDRQTGGALARQVASVALAAGGTDLVRARAAEAGRLVVELDERAASYQRLCWWLLTWNRTLEQAVETSGTQRRELESTGTLDQGTRRRLAQLRTATLRSQADLGAVQLVLAEAEALRDEALTLAEEATDGYRSLLVLLQETGDTPPLAPSGRVIEGQIVPPSVPDTAILAELRSSMTRQAAGMRLLHGAVHGLFAPPPGPAPGSVRYDAFPARRRHNPTWEAPGFVGPVAAVAVVLLIILGWAVFGRSTTPSPNPTTTPASTLATAGSGQIALNQSWSAGQVTPAPPQPPDDVRTVAGPGCLPVPGPGAIASAQASDSADWQDVSVGCGTGALVSGADENNDLLALDDSFTWTLSTGRTDTQQCALSVWIPPGDLLPPPSPDTGPGLGFTWATQATYAITMHTTTNTTTTPTAKRTFNQNSFQNTWVPLDQNLTLHPGQSVAVSLSAAPTLDQGTLMASDIELDCQTAANP